MGGPMSLAAVGQILVSAHRGRRRSRLTAVGERVSPNADRGRVILEG